MSSLLPIPQLRVTLDQLPTGFTRGLFMTENYLKGSSVSARQLALVRLRASILNQCSFCLDMHRHEPPSQTLSDQEILSISTWQSHPHFTEDDRLVLSLTDALVEVKDELGSAFEEIRTRWDEKTACDLCLAIVQMGAWNRLSKVFGFQPPRRHTRGEAALGRSNLG